MNKTTLCAVILLTVLWIILRENFMVSTVITGIAASSCCLFFYHRLLPLPKIKNINPFKLALYPFYIIIRVYLSGFNTIRLIFTGADAEIIEVKTRISDVFLRTVLASSITLIPGSISLELKDDAITVLWLKKKANDHQQAQNAVESIKNKLEKILIKAED